MARFSKRDLTPEQTERLKEKMLDALEFHFGLENHSCQAVGIPYGLYKEWFADDSFFRDKVYRIKENAIDFVESKLLENVKKNNQRAIEFYLRKKAKSRGYGEEFGDTIPEGAKIMGWTVVPVKSKSIENE